MAEVHTKTGAPCLWPAHIFAYIGPTPFTTRYDVVCQNTGPITQPPGNVPPRTTYSTLAAAQTAANDWLTTVGAI